VASVHPRYTHLCTLGIVVSPVFKSAVYSHPDSVVTISVCHLQGGAYLVLSRPPLSTVTATSSPLQPVSWAVADAHLTITKEETVPSFIHASSHQLRRPHRCIYVSPPLPAITAAQWGATPHAVQAFLFVPAMHSAATLQRCPNHTQCSHGGSSATTTRAFVRQPRSPFLRDAPASSLKIAGLSVSVLPPLRRCSSTLSTIPDHADRIMWPSSAW